MNQLTVFISSTCYDLKQIRADLFDFVSSLGYRPMLSEYDSFPIDPDSDTLENCLHNVRSTDLFILIVGNRYGYVTASGKSITNTEYLYARQHGIPVYVFIHRALITLYPIWKANPTSDFSSTVDSTKVFEFVEELRTTNKTWCFEFEKAQDIVQTLRMQFSHLYKQSLELSKKIRQSATPDFFNNLSSRALNIILKKDELYEAEFFLQTLQDQLKKYESLKLDLKYRVLTACTRKINDVQDLVDWFDTHFNTLNYLISSLNNLFSEAFKVFYGEPGQPSDLKGLYYVAEAISRIYKELTCWCINVKSLEVQDDFMLLRDTLSNMPNEALNCIWEYPITSLDDINKAKLNPLSSNGIQINAVLTLTMDRKLVEIVSSELDRLTRKVNQVG
jgi:hypothetical protein